MPYQSRISSWRNETDRPSSVRADIRTLGAVPASVRSTLKSSTVTTVPLKSCFSQCVAPMRNRSPRAISSGEVVRLVFRAPAYNNRHPVRIGPFSIRQGDANRRSRIRCDSARTSARVRASTTLDLPGFARW